MCKVIGKSNERILFKLSKSEISRLYSIVHVAMETTKTSHFTCQSKSFISIFFTCQVSACELQPFSFHDLANDIYSQNAKTVFSHLNHTVVFKTKVLYFKIENTPIKDKRKQKVQKNAQFPFCGQTAAFRFEIVFRGIQPCFLHGGSERLACFEPTEAAGVSEET